MDKKIVLVSHGKLAEGLEYSVGMIFGKSDRLSAFGLMPDGNYLEVVGRIKQLVESEPATQFIVVADIFGGSVCNGCMQEILDEPNVRLVSGMNMPLVLSLLVGDEAMSDEQIQAAIEEGRQGLMLVEAPKADEVSDGADDFF